MLRYFLRKLGVYSATFVVAVTIDWAIPHLMPGNPVLTLMGRIQVQDPKVAQQLYDHYMRAFNLDLPLWKQYGYFWISLFHGDLGTSILQFPTPVTSIIGGAAPYTLGLLIPAILLSWYAGNKVGALAARRKVLDNTALPLGYALTATPYMWLAILLSWAFAVTWKVFPVGFAYDPTQGRGWTWDFVGNLLWHWFLPFMSLFLVSFGGWAIGMRNMIIYELESDYAHYLEALGAPQRLVRKYAFRNALLPLITLLGPTTAFLVTGAFVVEVLFNIPGIGRIAVEAVGRRDYPVIQGTTVILGIAVVIMNLISDLLYHVFDPRISLTE